ncbi:MAG TPA: Ig-like domain-containing protein, partial [Cytophagaceae bacterium]
TGWLRSVDLANPEAGWQELFPSGFSRILGLSTGIDGNLYYSEFGGNGNLWVLEYTLTTIPAIVNQPLNQTVIERDPVTFSVTVNGTAPFTYQWQKNGVNIPGANAISYTIPSVSLADAGNYRVVVTNEYGSVTSNAATLTVEPYNAAPVAKILTPLTTTKWSVGDVIQYSGIATDEEDGTLPPSAFEWEVDLWHVDCPTCGHFHPGPGAPDGVTSGSFIADNGGETSHNIWLRLHLIVRDSKGRIGRDSVDIYPNKVDITIESTRPGLEVALGSSSVTPYTKTMVVNALITTVAVTPQTFGDSVFTFTSWDHGGPATQEIRIPSVNTTFKANYFGAFDDKKNLALQKPVFASTELGGNTAGAAVDGLPNSRWESIHNVDPQWIYVDLGAVYSINRVVVHWENAKARDYRIEISNDINNWGTPVKTVVGNNQDLNDWEVAGTGRYVRIYGTSRTTIYGYSIFELEVYGAASGTGNISPSVALTAPVNNATFTAPANITLTATASDPDGSIAKVEFYNGNQLLGEATSSPYTFNWTNVGPATYTITAKAIDNQNAVTTSSPVIIVVGNEAENQLPTVTITSPVNNSIFTALANITFSANASDSDGSIVKVEYFNGSQSIGESLTSPYTITWSGIAAGTYTITAIATDNKNATSTSAAITVVVESGQVNENLALQKPIFASSIENGGTPVNGANDGIMNTRWSSQFSDPQWIYVDLGAVYDINRVKIYWEAAKASNYQIEVSNDINNWGTPVKVVTGNNASENDWAVSATGRYVRIYGTTRTTVYGYSIYELEVYGTAAGTNQLPTVGITSPANNTVLTAPATITINATAEDSDGSVALVEFYNGTQKIGEDASSPYSITWSGVAAGTYTITARATDNQSGVTISAPVTVVVEAVVENQVPIVSITSPANNTVHTAPATITINATATDSDGSVVLVEFYNGTQKIGEDASSPYSITWSDVVAGTYTITAKAIDDDGDFAVSTPVTITVENVVGNVNLALQKPVYVSSIENGAFAAPYAVDGIMNTRWSSQFSDPQWIYVDLGAIYNLSSIKIYWEYAKARDYRIEVSNDINNWGNPVKVVTGNEAAYNEWAISATGRYVRIYGTSRTTMYGYSIFELEVYGSSTAKYSDLFNADYDEAQQMSVYPNPISTEVFVQATFNSASHVNVIIIDAGGFVVYDKDFENKTGSFEQLINIADLPKGVYVIKLFSGDQVYSQKMVKD